MTEETRKQLDEMAICAYCRLHPEEGDDLCSLCIERLLIAQTAYELGEKDGRSAWIDVKDRLPEIGKEVIGGAYIEAIYVDGRTSRGWQQCLQIWTGKEWRDSDTGEVDGATHWMPLPEPPTDAGRFRQHQEGQ